MSPIGWEVDRIICDVEEKWMDQIFYQPLTWMGNCWRFLKRYICFDGQDWSEKRMWQHVPGQLGCMIWWMTRRVKKLLCEQGEWDLLFNFILPFPRLVYECMKGLFMKSQTVGLHKVCHWSFKVSFALVLTDDFLSFIIFLCIILP